MLYYFFTLMALLEKQSGQHFTPKPKTVRMASSVINPSRFLSWRIGSRLFCPDFRDTSGSRPETCTVRPESTSAV